MTRLIDERQATNPAAVQILEVLDRGRYVAASGNMVQIGQHQALAEAGTRLYEPDELVALRDADREMESDAPADVAILDATTQVAAHEHAQRGDVVLLNFASARNPGGGFLGGARAQEEDLCRCSGLYRTLLTQSTFYTLHRQQRSLLYTDHLIYSPMVPFFRTSSTAPLLDEPFLASVITAPAPNAGAIRRNQPDAATALPETFARRWANVLAVARDNGHRTLILGAWGCGAFRNDPRLVARTARVALQSPAIAGALGRVVFAIPSFNKHSQVNLDAFRQVFSGL